MSCLYGNTHISRHIHLKIGITNTGKIVQYMRVYRVDTQFKFTDRVRFIMFLYLDFVYKIQVF